METIASRLEAIATNKKLLVDLVASSSKEVHSECTHCNQVLRPHPFRCAEIEQEASERLISAIVPLPWWLVWKTSETIKINRLPVQNRTVANEVAVFPRVLTLAVQHF